MQSKLWPRVLAFLVWALAAGSAVAWSLQWMGRLMTRPDVAVAAASGAEAPQALVDPSAVAMLLGLSAQAQAQVGAGSALAGAAPGGRLVLMGVVAGVEAAAALIAVDGKPPKPYRPGDEIEPGLVLQSVSARRAELGAELRGPAATVLEMALPPSAQAGM